MLVHSFDSSKKANEAIATYTDRPVQRVTEKLGNGLVLRSFTRELDSGAFTNIYDLSFPKGSTQPSIDFHDQPLPVIEHVRSHPELYAASSGAFFFLADKADITPRNRSLNLALSRKALYGLPVVDREALLLYDTHLEASYLQSLGAMNMNGNELSWSGSLTDYDSDVKIYGSGNCIIKHVPHSKTGSLRVLDEESHYTPAMKSPGLIDVGFLRRDGNTFVAREISNKGGMDIFRNDFVGRMHERHAHKQKPTAYFLSLGNKAIDSSLRGGISVGPMLYRQDFNSHPINQDRSLGDKPPFTDRPMARSVIYETDDGHVHIRIFDGRPGSMQFPGVTPAQSLEFTTSEANVVWGCFLDPGQSAKLVVRKNGALESYGNAHYLQWPTNPNEPFVWRPTRGRPMANVIGLSRIT